MSKRYSLPEGKTYRPFGSSEVITNQNITDQMVESLIKQDPNHAKAFIDAAAPKSDENPGSEGISKLTKKELHAKYVELTGKPADEKLNHTALVALVKAEVDAKALLG